MADKPNQTNFVKYLPTVFQTTTEKKFFDATFDQVFSKADNELLYAYLGRREGGLYNPVSDYYVPEPTKNRTWWQLEATAFARDTDNTKDNIFFYDDLLNKINYYGGNTQNQNRLFSSEYYSWCPPIDPDMFINYQNYYWVEQRLPSIAISGGAGHPTITSSDIIGQLEYTTPLTAIPPGLTLSSGMRITLPQDNAEFQQPHTVENVGEQGGIRLIPDYPDYISRIALEFLPWDGFFQLSNGRTIDNTRWDQLPWETEAVPFAGDYITISRGSIDRNAWSRTNKWYHIDVINETIRLTGSSFPPSASRALRPIIQFIPDLQLFGSGTQFRAAVQYAYTVDETDTAIILSDYQDRNVIDVNDELGSNLIQNDLVIFFNDSTTFGSSTVKDYIFQVSISGNIIHFSPYTSTSTPVLVGDIVFITDSSSLINNPLRGSSWYYQFGQWQEVVNDKFKANQAPLFQLYDHNYIPLNDFNVYPNNNFGGSEIFSYKINDEPGAFIDPVLGFPIVYTSLGQASDIVFENNLMVDRYTYQFGKFPINGYYYYKNFGITNEGIPTSFGNSWNLYQPTIPTTGPCTIVPQLPLSKQRVIDRYVVGYNSVGPQFDTTPDNILKFKLSVYPNGYTDGCPDIIVAVNGVILRANQYSFEEINQNLYIDLTTYLTGWNLVPQGTQPPVVEAFSFTNGLLSAASPGYYEIPQQLEANPNQEEIFETTASILSDQFSSIIENQLGFIGVAYGGDNNFRDTAKNLSLGKFILQNRAPLLKTMLISSSDDLDIINSTRFSEKEYINFKVKYLRTAQQLIKQRFTPSMIHNNGVVISDWVDEIFKVINISKEFSNAFAYSYMIATGKVYAQEQDVVPAEDPSNPGYSYPLQLTYHVDINDPKNVVYIYDITGIDPGSEKLLLIEDDYSLIQTSSIDPIEVVFNLSNGNTTPGDIVSIKFYQNPIPAYVPSTPSKIGTYKTYKPEIVLDTTYADPVLVIVGHDGSRTVAKGDYTDQLILELEKRIYNGIVHRFRDQYNIPLQLQEIDPGYFRLTHYSQANYLTITESYLNKWSAKYNANYRINEYDTFSPLVSDSRQWMLWNYTTAVDATSQQPLQLKGSWKAVFKWHYDTIYPDTRPWEMLGFSEIPSWWISEYTTSWGSSNTALWNDLENGIIRHGPCAIYDPLTGNPVSNPLWSRPGLSHILPVTSGGLLRTVPHIFNVLVADNYAPFDGFKDPWVYGDIGPVEQAWMNSSDYPFNVNEFLYLMNPGPFGEFYFDTIGAEYSPTSQYVQNDQYLPYDFYVQVDTYFKNGAVGSGDPNFFWMRPKNNQQIVHAESLPDGDIIIRFGYQRWISDYLLYLGKNITENFGNKIRTLDVNLANKFAGFTNKDTTRVYLESVTPGASTTSLLIPSNNYEVDLHVGPAIATYSYSGVIIRAFADGTFGIYGYDLIRPSFRVFTRQPAQGQKITVGGTPVSWINFQTGLSYKAGDIIRYNSVYYQSKETQINVQKFDSSKWIKLNSLPVSGGINVTYYPYPTKTLITIPYGTIFKTAQEVFDVMIGWGDYLKSRGWKFDDVNTTTNQVSDWLYSAKQFLFWLNTEWAPDASIQLSPLANSATLQVARGYPSDVEVISNGVYSILDKFGIAIKPFNTIIERNNQAITVIPKTLTAGGIYYLQVSAKETEHILIFDNRTSFNDVIYNPLYRTRQERLRFNGFRSKNWFGKMEAPGYLILGNQLLPNYDTIVNDIKYYYDPDVTIDNPSAEDLGRHLIGYESKSFLDNLQVSNDIQYLFYQGMIRQKGTRQSFNKLFRSSAIINNVASVTNAEKITVFEEWALKLGNFGNTIEQVDVEFILQPEQNRGESIVARLNYIPDTIGFVKSIDILNAETIYIAPPPITIARPTGIIADPTKHRRRAKAFAVLDPATSKIMRIDISDPGYGYITNPTVVIGNGDPSNPDRIYSVYQGEIQKDVNLDNIVDIDIDETDVWLVRPPEPSYSLIFPTTPNIYYDTPNSGYASKEDVNWLSFDLPQTISNWGTSILNPTKNDTLWIAKDVNADWNIVKLVSYSETIPENSWDEYLQNPPYSDQNIDWDGITFPLPAQGTATLSPGSVAGFNITNPGLGYVIPPTVTISGNGTGATASAQITNGKVSSISIINAGAGYTTATATLSAPSSNVTATGTVTTDGNVVSNIVITNGGHFYTSPPTVTISGPGTGASATAVILNGMVVGVTGLIPGTGYTSATVTFAAPTASVVTATAKVNLNCSISAITVTAGGTQYVTPPTVSISGGTGAVAKANINSAGHVSSVTIVSGGTGYSSPVTVSFSTAPITNQYLGLFDQGFEIYPDNAGQLILSVIGTDLTSNNDLSYISLQNIENNKIFNNETYLVGVKYIAPRIETRQITEIVYYGDYNYPPGSDVGPVSISYQVQISWQDYEIIDSSGVQLSTFEIPTYNDLNQLFIFKTMRFAVNPTQLPYYVNGLDKIWVDKNTNLKWAVYRITTDRHTALYREQAELINTKLFENAQIYQNKNSQELVLLPVYDPFKGILPNLAQQNITYKSYQDPARYNITTDPRLFSQNKLFGPLQVGQLWWDYSNCRYFYYEQPTASTKSDNDNLVFRRNNWGQLFPGSSIDIYEWVESTVPPDQYTGIGTPRSTTDSVQITRFNSLTNILESRYYFWVLNATDQPNKQNRTLSATQVARLLSSPKTQGYSFFSPIQQTFTNNSYMFYNVQDILAYKGNNVQIQYRTSERDDQKHTQWGFYREGDSTSLIPEAYWNKFVDSICTYTEVLPITNEFGRGIIVPGGEILPVPDPVLGPAESYGIEYRPRQNMFVNIPEARKIFWQSANNLLIHIPIRDINSDWNQHVTSNNYWTYVNWYEVGYENAIPQTQYETLAEANVALLAGLLIENEIVKIIEGTDEVILADKRYALYSVTKIGNTSNMYLKLIAYESSAVQFLPTIYTVSNVYNLAVELRQMLDAIKNVIFINSYLVDVNLLFFAMLNFVLSEQKNPYWVFKSSYIYIKEENVPLNQPNLYVPDQIDNIIGYINDVKPYHTQIRDYTTSYINTDVTPGEASDKLNFKIIATFGPGGGDEFPGHWDAENPDVYNHNWDQSAWDSGMPMDSARLYGNLLDAETFTDNIQQYISDELAYQISLTFEDNSKKGYSQLYPYTFELLENGNSFLVPSNIIAVQIAGRVLYYGNDYYAGINDDNTYTVYFYNDPMDPITNPSHVYPDAFVLFDAGSFTQLGFNPYRNEIVSGTAKDNLVVIADTQLYVNNISGVYTPINQTWDADVNDDMGEIINAINHTPGQLIGWDSHTTWDQDVIINPTPLDAFISHRENTSETNVQFMRNNESASGVLVDDISSISESFVVEVSSGIDIFPAPTPASPAVLWIAGERIRYLEKVQLTSTTWEFTKLIRGTDGTIPTGHLIGDLVFVEKDQRILDANYQIWNAVNNEPFAPVALGGLWYAQTTEAVFLRKGQGKAVPSV